ncbi:GIP, partial [Symbiodinium microadriaticum]
EQLQEKLAELGETAPSRWTKKEIIQRILELDPEADKAPSKQRTDLQTRIKDLGVASRKKSTLVDYCQSIGIGVEPNDTIYRLEQRALRRLYDVSEILVQRPTYAMWVKQTAAETTETDYRLRRLAGWLEQQTTEEVEMVRAPKEKIKAKAKAMAPPPSTAQSSSDNTAVLMQSLLETVQGLQQEVQEMRAERPRKEVRAPPSETDESKSSYQMVEPRPKSK